MGIDDEFSIGRRVASGAVFMVLLRLAFRGIGLISTLILVRLLAPSDFGLVGIAIVAYSVLEMLSELSFKVALVRMKSPLRMHYDTAWTLGVLRGFAIAASLIAAAPFLASFIRDARTEALIYALAALPVIQGFENVRLTELQRNIQFDRLFWYQLAGKVAGFAVVVPAAYFLRSYWALFWGIAAARFVLLPLGYAMRPYRPRFCLAGWSELFDFSKWLLITNVLWAIDANAMSFLIGRIAGSAAIGTYQVANQIALLPASEIAAPIREPMYSGYARVLDDPAALRKQFLDGLGVMVAVTAPMAFGIAVIAEPLTSLFLGANWAAAAPLIQFCAFYGFFDAVGHFTHNLYLALHRQRAFVALLFWTLVVRILLIVSAGYVWGVNGAALTLAVSAAFNMVVWNAWIAPAIGVSTLDFVRCTWRTFFAGVIMMAATAWLLAQWPAPSDTTTGYLRLAAACIWGTGVQVLVQYGLWHLAGRPDGAEAYLVRVVRSGLLQLLPPSRRGPSIWP
jgi:PST family polysaccharide transporter